MKYNIFNKTNMATVRGLHAGFITKDWVRVHYNFFKAKCNAPRPIRFSLIEARTLLRLNVSRRLYKIIIHTSKQGKDYQTYVKRYNLL